MPSGGSADFPTRKEATPTATSASLATPKDYGDEIVKLRGELASLKSDLRNRELEIRDLRSIVASTTSQSDVAHIFGKSLKPHIATVGDFVSDVVLDAQKYRQHFNGLSYRKFEKTIAQLEQKL